MTGITSANFAFLAVHDRQLLAALIERYFTGDPDTRLIKPCLAHGAMANRHKNEVELCKKLGLSRQTLCRSIGPTGALRSETINLLEAHPQ
jgi:hypothetical protein